MEHSRQPKSITQAKVYRDTENVMEVPEKTIANNGTDCKIKSDGSNVRSYLGPMCEKGAKYRGSSRRTPRYPGTGMPILANAKGARRESAAEQTYSMLKFSTHDAQERSECK